MKIFVSGVILHLRPQQGHPNRSSSTGHEEPDRLELVISDRPTSDCGRAQTNPWTTYI
ncbi:hypothetical protein CDEST_00871 [Colletotrichum destructivum]|uniref:Uncharacterized protein n=1 Tax=Colletotrichum destructivum TaxID=34406 RepID=A0AAX4HYJ7_9PEZI|nr:hypothetical protein CDEST_00871 [Colletotrichum destructivum]